MAVLGGKLVGDDLKFLDGIFRHQPHGPADNVVIEISSVHANARATRGRPAGDDAAVEALRWVVGGRGGHTGNQVGKLLEVPVVDGQGRNLQLLDVSLDLRTGEIHLRSLAADTDCLCLPSQVQDKIGGESIPDIQIQSLQRFHGEPGLGDAYLISAARKEVETVKTLLVRCCLAAFPVFHVHRRGCRSVPTGSRRSLLKCPLRSPAGLR